jgi:hypothetical protein
LFGSFHNCSITLLRYEFTRAASYQITVRKGIYLESLLASSKLARNVPMRAGSRSFTNFTAIRPAR